MVNINNTTYEGHKIYAVIGHPVSHSKSPWLFNHIFQHLNYPAVYLAFDHIKPQVLISAMRELSISGFSVTVPHKESCFDLVDETDELARSLGCINTIHNRQGMLWGSNTDGLGAIRAIENYEIKAGVKAGSWRSKDITFLGAGGAARGVALSMVHDAHDNMSHDNFTGSIKIIARTPSKAQGLVDQLSRMGINTQLLDWKTLPQEPLISDIIINTTTLGMNMEKQGNTENHTLSPLSALQYHKESTYFDIVYTPLRTAFLRMAQDIGAATIDGLDMFLAQANQQLKVWTGKSLELEQLRTFFLSKS